MADIPTKELICDVRRYLRCLAPHARSRKAALLLGLLADRVEQSQADARRYRWLAEATPGIVAGIAYRCKGACKFSEAEVDQAVDAAIIETPESKEDAEAPKEP